MLEIEVFVRTPGLELPVVSEIQALCTLALASAGITDGHMAVELVDERRIAELNERHRGRSGPTDVLAFPVDGADELAQGEARELGDVVICPELASDVNEAAVHGALHLAGMDHETDNGEMLAVQRELLAWQRRDLGP